MSSLGANVLDVNHERRNTRAAIGSCVVNVSLETRDKAHIQEIFSSLPHLPGDAESIMISRYPTGRSDLEFPVEAGEMERVLELIRAIRNRRAEMNIAPSRKAAVFIETRSADAFNSATAPFFARLASASGIEVAESFPADRVSADTCVQVVTPAATAYLPLSDLVDYEKERARLTAEIAKVSAEVGLLIYAEDTTWAS